MHKNPLHLAISSAASRYPACSNVLSPRTPRRTPRTPRTPGFGRMAQESQYGNFLSPGAALLTPNYVAQTPRTLGDGGLKSAASSIALTPQGTNFLVRSPSCLTPFLVDGPAVEKTEAQKLGTFSAINIILGKTIGVGIYSVPSSIFKDVGSVGMTFVIWALAAFISFCGLSVYLDLGTAMPKSGGEKVYLERIFKKPKYLATCIFMSYVVLLGFSTPNCIVLGEYAMYALNIEPNTWNVRSIAVIAVTASCIVHSRAPKLGLRLINILGVIKLAIIAGIILAGVASIFLQVGLQVSEEDQTSSTTFTRNFSKLFNSSSYQPYAYATALLKALYCFRGYNTANQVMSEIRNPKRTLRIAAPSALALCSVAYLLTNFAYLCAVDADTFQSSGVVAAARFFTAVFGHFLGSRILPLLIILSAFGSIAATSFAQARVNQELGASKILPFPRFFASSYPWGTPSAGLFLHWLVSVAVIVIPPPGEVYSFLVTLGAYPVSCIAIAVSGGLLYLRSGRAGEVYTSPTPAPRVAVWIFLLSNVALVILPWVPPEVTGGNCMTGVAHGRHGGSGGFAYYAYPAGGLAVLLLGAAYWVWWAKVKGWIEVLGDGLARSDLRREDEKWARWRSEMKEESEPVEEAKSLIAS